MDTFYSQSHDYFDDDAAMERELNEQDDRDERAERQLEFGDEHQPKEVEASGVKSNGR